MKNDFYRRFFLSLGIITFLIISANLKIYSTGNHQPEFSKFESVTNNNMVNEFDGSFTYNLPLIDVPGPNGSGYSLSLSYHSGSGPEEEASWVGYGWTLNPGSIIRQKRGFPDDYKGELVTYWNKTVPNITLTDSKHGSLEILSNNQSGANGTYCESYNNYRGFTTLWGIGINGMNSLNLNFSFKNGTLNSFTFYPPGLGPLVERTMGYLNYINQFSCLILHQDIKQIFSEEIRPTNTFEYSGEVTNTSVTSSEDFSLGFGVEVGNKRSESYLIPVFSKQISAFGYIYSGDIKDNTSIMDYYLENESSFNKRNYFLHIPFNNADNFILSGEGIKGGFRAYNRKPGHFRPNYKKSEIPIFEKGGQGHLGPSTIGLGVDLGIGSQTTEIGKWESSSVNDYTFAASDECDESIYFKFYNDAGGQTNFIESNQEGIDLIEHSPMQAGLELSGDNLLFDLLYPSYNPIIPTNLFKNVNNNNRSGRSSYIGYNLVKNLKSKETPCLIPYDCNNNTNLQDVNDNLIGEYSVTNNEGYRYVYGIPVFCQNEKDLNFGLTREVISTIDNNNNIAYFVHSKGLNTSLDNNSKNITNAEVVVGEERSGKYAGTFLLTLITTPDYVDIDHNGPSSNDLGGYTKFNYRKVTSGNLYKWRLPYYGLSYNKNQISTNMDDYGSVSMGEREIYYLESIETKTHIAYFITNKTTISVTVDGVTKLLEAVDKSERKDCFPVLLSESETSEENYQNNHKIYESQTNIVEKLERIELYSKNPAYPDDKTKLLKLIKSVYFNFDQDYPIWPQQPNSMVKPDGINSYGKLTLKKVWFEYEGIANPSISPYIFDYKYENYNYPNEYTLLNNYGTSLISNPDYSRAVVDRWGLYRAAEDGNDQNQKMKPWVNQTPSNTFDPAAWQLKRIILPSQGEIHLQYEQNDYSYVQDRQVTAMMNLMQIDYNQANPPLTSEYVEAYLNLSYLGINPNDDNTFNKLLDSLRTRFLPRSNNGHEELIYYKFLYSLCGNNPAINNYNSEYISGYAKVTDICSSTLNQVRTIKFRLEDGNGGYSPHKKCVDFYKTFRYKIFDPYTNNIKNDVDALTYKFLTDYSKDVLIENASEKLENKDNSCEECNDVNPELSYLRIPMINIDKKGGGIRVKRLLFFDKFNKHNESSSGFTPSLYGNEYIYKTVDEKSSGVATNEPVFGQDENPIINYMKIARDQNWFQIFNNGEDLSQFDGPLGKSILPSPSIGYSRVIIKNIHQGISNPGFTVKEYFTKKDWPFDSTFTVMYNNNKVILNCNSSTPIHAGDPIIIPPLTPYFIYSVSKIWLTQGFQFIDYNIHGLPKSTTTYGGNFLNKATWSQSSQQEYVYFHPIEKLPVLYGLDSVRFQHLGREMEILFDSRTISEDQVNVQGDLDLVFPIPLGWPVPSVSFGASISNSESNMHVTNKLISYTPFIKKIINSQDGIVKTTENIAFDPYSGSPILTRTYDGYDKLVLDPTLHGSPTIHNGTYYNYSFPASYPYFQMGQKAVNERMFFKSFNGIGTPSCDTYIIKRRCENPGTSSEKLLLFFHYPHPCGTNCNIMSKFSPGDLLEVTLSGSNKNSTLKEYYHIGSIENCNCITLLPMFQNQITFSSNEMVDVEIIRSGRTNQLNTIAGNVTTYGQNVPFSDIDEILYDQLLQINDPEINKRIAFANSLNSCINTNCNPLEISDPPSIKDINGNCNSLSPSDISIKFRYPTYLPGGQPRDYTLCVNKTNSIDPTPLIADSLTLIKDLNQWLDKANKLRLDLDIPEYDWIHQCGTDPNPQKYFTNKVDDINIIKKVEELTGLTSILNSTYYIRDEYKKGSDFITKENGPLYYIADTHTGTNKALLASQTIKITLPGCNPDWWVGVKRQTIQDQDCNNNHPISCSYFTNACQLALIIGPNPIPDNSKIFNSYDNVAFFQHISDNEKFTDHYGKFHNNTDGQMYFETKCGQPYDGFTPVNIKSNLPKDTCCMTYCYYSPLKSYFSIDRNHGYKLIYNLMLDENDISCDWADNPWCSIFSCLDFCPDLYDNLQLNGVVAASALKFSDKWDFEPTLFGKIAYPTNDKYASGMLGKWHPEKEYVYKTSLKPPPQEEGPKAYNLGIFNDFTQFNWRCPDYSPNNWVNVNSNTLYSPDGHLLEEKNILSINSTQKYGHRFTVPKLEAQNASYNSVNFDSFENNNYDYGYGTNLFPTSTSAHSGKYSLILPKDQVVKIFDTLTYNQQFVEKGIIIKAWVRTNSLRTSPEPTNFLTTIITDDQSTPYEYQCQMNNYLVKTGEWALYECIVDNFQNCPSCSKYRISFKNIWGSISDTVWIDDIRVQPREAGMNCYVYDNNSLKLLTSFDDQHFGIYYQYNAEGKLVRQIRETSLGLKTISEAQFNTPLVDRDIDYIQPTSLFKPPDREKRFGKIDLGKPFQNKSTDIGNNPISNMKTNMLDINISPDKRDIKIFGIDKDSLKSPDSLLNIQKKLIFKKFKEGIKGLPKNEIDSLNINLNRIKNEGNDIKKIKETLNEDIELKENLNLQLDSLKNYQIDSMSIKKKLKNELNNKEIIIKKNK